MFTTSNTRKTLTVAAVLASTAVAFAQPQMVVRIDGVEVPSFTELTFEDQNLGQSEQIVVTLRNEGDEDLVFAETPPVQLSGAFAGQFSLVQPALEVGNKLSPNSSTAFAVRFEPDIEFTGLNANIFLFTNEAATPFRLRLQGNGTQPQLDVRLDGVSLNSEDTFAFGDVTVGETAEAVFALHNTGSGPMTLTEVPSVAGGLGEFVMAVETPELQIPAGDSTTVTVRFSPDDVRLFTSNLFIRSDAPNGDLFRLNLTGNAIEVEVEEEIDEEQDEQEEEIEDEVELEDEDELEEDDNNNDNNNQDPNDAGDFNDNQFDDPNDGNVQDPNDFGDLNEEDNEENNDEQDEIEIDLDDQDVLTPLTCGFGAGFASLASMASLSVFRRRRRWIR